MSTNYEKLAARAERRAGIDHARDAATGVPLDLRHALAKQGRLSKPVGRYHNGRTDLVRAQLNVPQDASTMDGSPQRWN